MPDCLAEAERITEQYGPPHAQGIWGGLTLRERGTLAGLGRQPIPCSICGLRCVPVNLATDRCSACDPSQTTIYEDYRPAIEALLEAGATYRQIAERLRLSTPTIAQVCEGWGKPSRAVSPPGRRPVKGCGTLAAKERHRKHNESWQDCACRHVPWKKGIYRKPRRGRGK